MPVDNINVDNLYNNNAADQINGQGQQPPQNGQQQQQQQQQQANLGDEILYYIQAAKEETKFEIITQLVNGFNAKYQQFAEVDPVLATAMKACAAAINESVPELIPIGNNSQFNTAQAQQQQFSQEQAMQQQQPQQKKASEKELSEFLLDTTLEKVASTGYFEQNSGYSEDVVRADLLDFYEIIVRGMDKFADANDIDFQDPNYWDTLKQLIDDGTLYQMGLEN